MANLHGGGLRGLQVLSVWVCSAIDVHVGTLLPRVCLGVGYFVVRGFDG